MNKKIFFEFELFFLFVLIGNVAFSQKKDSVSSFHRFEIVVNPLLMFGQKEYGGLFEYYIKKRISIEAGGGVNLNYSYPWEMSHQGISYGSGNGYTLRAGFRYYFKSGFYLNSVFFYRYMKYDNRYYETEGIKDPKLLYEPGFDNLTIFYNGDQRSGERLIETKQVFAFEALLGKEVRGKIKMDFYAGFGYRYKDIQDGITNTYQYYGAQYGPSGSNNPPYMKNIQGKLPTMQLGFQICF